MLVCVILYFFIPYVKTVPYIEDEEIEKKKKKNQKFKRI